MSSMSERACALAALGYRVFPLVKNTKKPQVEDWRNVATSDILEVIELWENKPNANIGLCTDGLMVVDVDKKKHDGFASLAKNGMEHGANVVVTPTGGQHWYFRPDEEWKTGAGILPGVDMRAEGGFVVAPGSEINGEAYGGTLAPLNELEPVPEPFHQLRVFQEQRAENASEAVVELDLKVNIDAAREWLHRSVEDGAVAVEGDGGDHFTFSTAAAVRDFGVSERECLELLIRNWNDHCEPPWDYEELAEKVANAYQYPKRPAGARAPSHYRDELLAAVTEDDRAQLAATDGAGGERPALGARNWRFYSGTEGLRQIPPIEWVVDKLLPRRDISILYGPSGSGKSFIAVDIALAIATGRPWCDQDTKQGAALYLAYEGGPGVPDRVEAWRVHNIFKTPENLNRSPEEYLEQEVPATFRLAYEALPRFDASENISDVLDFCDFLKSTGDISLVVVDTMSVATGAIDMNHYREATVFIDKWRMVAEACNCAVLLVGHTGKDRERGLYGSQAFKNNVPTHLVIKDDQKGEDSPYVHLVVDKQKDGKEERNGWAFRLLRRGNSLCAVPTPVKQSQGARLKAYRVRTALKILDASPIPLTTSALHAQMVNLMALEDDAETAANLKKFLTNFYSQQQSFEGLEEYCYMDGGKRMWAHPSLQKKRVGEA